MNVLFSSSDLPLVLSSVEQVSSGTRTLHRLASQWRCGHTRGDRLDLCASVPEASGENPSNWPEARPEETDVRRDRTFQGKFSGRAEGDALLADDDCEGRRARKQAHDRTLRLTARQGCV